MEAYMFTNGHQDRRGPTEAEASEVGPSDVAESGREPEPAPDLHSEPAPDLHSEPAPDLHSEPAPDAHSEPAPDAHSELGPDPDTAERGDETSSLAEAAGLLDAVEAALGRLEDGTFDQCEICGDPIGRERLLRDPLLTRCAEHTGPR